MSSYKLLVSLMPSHQQEDLREKREKKQQELMNNLKMSTQHDLRIFFISSLIGLLIIYFAAPVISAPSTTGASTCRRELENANRTMAQWGETMEGMVNESKLPANVREAIHNEANQILDLIEDFGEQINNRPVSQLAKDLVAIRRRSNRMALDIYLNTFDMRWPQTSLGVGVTVERVQQACLNKDTIAALESPSNPLAPLSYY